MNKKEMIGKVAGETGFLKKDVEKMTDCLLTTILEALAHDEKVQLVGFGTFEVRRRAARNCKNPRTGEMFLLEEMHIPAFRAGKALKETVSRR